MRQSSTQKRGAQSANYNELMQMRELASQSNSQSAKQFDETMLEPQVDSDFMTSIISGGGGGKPKRTRTGQHRASDGKFESGFGGGGGRKNNYNAFAEISGTKGHSEAPQTGGNRKGGRKQRGGGGTVGSAFYDSAMPS